MAQTLGMLSSSMDIRIRRMTDGRWLIGDHSVIPLLLLIARSKLVPDFALTIHGIHLVCTSLYSHAVPRNLFWWGLQAASATLMVSLGIWSCQWRELQPLKFGALLGGGNGAASGAHDNQASAGTQGEDLEMGEMK